jgi:DNA gyrase subunit A
VRPMGRSATGVRGVMLKANARAIGMIVAHENASILAISELGYGKRVASEDYRMTKRGAKGVLTIKTTPKTGPLVAMMEISETDELIIVTNNGVVIRQSVEKIREMGRVTQGVRLIKLDSGDKVADVAKVVKDEDEAAEAELGPEPNGIGEG